jgi:hypothetical protein
MYQICLSSDRFIHEIGIVVELLQIWCQVLLNWVPTFRVWVLGRPPTLGSINRSQPIQNERGLARMGTHTNLK